MITKEKALEIVENFLIDSNEHYVSIAEIDEVYIDEKNEITYSESKYYEQERDVYVVNFDIEGHNENIPLFMLVDVETGEIICVMTPHGSMKP